jgi:hypothetical protein
VNHQAGNNYSKNLIDAQLRQIIGPNSIRAGLCSVLESIFFSCIIPVMNKRAKKRLKETIEKENLERAKIRNEQNQSSPKEPQERRGFISKPAKKRG